METFGTKRFVYVLLGCLAVVLSPLALDAQEVSVIVNGNELEDGDTFYTPMGKKGSGNKVALFSKSDANYGINNETEEEVTIKNIELDHAEGVKSEEFVLLNTENDPKPLEVDNETVKPDGQFQFMLRFYPVRSGERKTTVTVTYGDGKTYEWTVIGTGRNNGYFFSPGTTVFQKLLGTPETDEMATAMVADENGNLFFSGHGSEVVDKYNNDIFLGRLNSDGDIGWVKIWNSEEDDRSRDPGQNGETGGSGGAMALDEDGNVYFAGARDNAAILLKLNPETGEPVWERYWMAGWPSYSGGRHDTNDAAEAYAVDVSGDTVYVTGTTGANKGNSNAYVLLLAFDRNSGDVIWQKAVDLYEGYNDRGYAVQADGNGHLYVAGSGNNDGYLAKFKVGTSKQELLWAKNVELGTGGNVNSIDVDGEGNVYLSCDRRGAQTHMSVARVGSDGNLDWGKTWTASNTDSNNSHVVRVIGDHVYFGGRIGLPKFDAQMGDGALMKLKKSDGSPAWTGFYYTGKGPDEITEHRIKGIARAGSSLYLFGQVYSGSQNRQRFWGYWYDGVGEVTSFEPTISDIDVDSDKGVITPEEGKAKDASDKRNFVDGMKHFTFQDARNKSGGEFSDGDLMLWKINLEENQKEEK